jgi:DNA-binding response OmpR family regulator
MQLARPILVVDDDAKIVRLVRTYLERDGFRVVEASDGKSALAAIALEAPALVVLDLMLPEVDGLSIIRAVRRNDRTPMLILSARGTTADRIAGLEAGADDYLPKPFSPAELVVRVKRILDRSTAGSVETPALSPSWRQAI